MCTVGAVFTKKGTVLAFKTVDIRGKWRLPKTPVVRKGSRYRYMKFGTHLKPSKSGLWAGVNQKGLALLGADALGLATFWSKKFGGFKELTKTYEKVIGTAATAREALNIFIDEFQKQRIGLDGDIILLADRKEAIAVEYSFNQWGIQFSGSDYCLVRTNFFLVLRHLRHLPQEKILHLSALKRYERALELLSKTTNQTTVENIKDLCRDHYPEPGGMSICKHGGEGEHKTCGSAIFELTPKKIITHYNIGANPCEDDYQIKTRF